MKKALSAVAVGVIVLGAFYWHWRENGRPRNELEILGSANAAQTADVDALAFNDHEGSIIFGGDIMLARTVEARAKSAGWENVFTAIQDALNTADCRVANLESPFKKDKPATQSGSLVFAAKPEAVAALTAGRISAVSLANNHITDQGLGGLQETKALLSQNSLVFGGAGETQKEADAPRYLHCGTLKVGLVFGTYGTNFAADGVLTTPLEGVAEIIKEAKNQADVVVVVVHWGSEYQTIPSPFQKELAHRYIDAGASLVIGSHPHVIQPIESYNGGVIAYSLGNLVFDQAAGGEKTEAILLRVAFSPQKTSYDVSPIQIKNYFQPQLAGRSGDVASHYLETLNLDGWQWEGVVLSASAK